MFQRKYTREEIEEDEKAWRDWWDNPDAVTYRRRLKTPERKKRGCELCAHLKRETRGEAYGEDKVDDLGLRKNERLYFCTFPRCPLHEMDRYRDYGAYSRAEREKIDRILKKALGIEVKKARKKKAEAKKPRKYLDSKERWLVGCRHSQGFEIEDIAREFDISVEQAKEVIAQFKAQN